MTTAGETLLRIGELSRRTGVSPELLRAWERRYGLLDPVRSAGGLRLYTLDDLDRVLRMQAQLASGLSAAEAARAAAEQPPAAPADGLAPAALRTELAAALDAFDEERAHAVIDRAVGAATLDVVLDDVLLPYLTDLGARWQRGEVSIAQEHFATSVVRSRLLGLARDWGSGVGPRAVLACLPGERHDLGLIAFGVALRSRGWRIAYLGADTPFAEIEAAAGALDPKVVALASVTARRVAGCADDIAALARTRTVALGGAGARGADHAALGTVPLAERVGAAAAAAGALIA